MSDTTDFRTPSRTTALKLFGRRATKTSWLCSAVTPVESIAGSPPCCARSAPATILSGRRFQVAAPSRPGPWLPTRSHPAAVARVPYIVVEVELEEQAELCMISNLINADDDAITFGAAVAVQFRVHASGQKLPVFALL